MDVSSTIIDGQPGLRSVAANPSADPEQVVNGVVAAARGSIRQPAVS